MSTFLQYVVDALSGGSLYALYALGIALIFGIMRLVNVAYGEQIMASAYVIALTDGMPLAWRVLLAIAVAVCLGVLMEVGIFRWARSADPTTLLVLSFGVSYGLQNLAQLVFGPDSRSASLGPFFDRPISWGGVTIARTVAVTVVVTVIMLVLFGLLVRKTDLGLQMRAAAEDLTMTRMLGVPANRVIGMAFAWSGVLAGVGGILLVSQTGTVSPTMGLNPMLFGLIGAIVGGMGSLGGAVLGGYLVGAGTGALQVLLPLGLRPSRDVFLFIAVFAVLALRPDGLLGRTKIGERV